MSQAAQRFKILCTGTVQGVGFRPSVYRLATELGLVGWVRNGPDGVVIEVEGESGVPQRFAERLLRELPPLANVEQLDIQEIALKNESCFEVRETKQGPRKRALVPPDTRLCQDCENEMADENDRRHNYAFTVCTNCGPRFSLVKKLPYDREQTSMSCFPLCASCKAEYQNPADRRFHAEPVCCPECGPKLWAIDCGGRTIGEADQAIALAQSALETGGIVALKGLGGFQLACCARSNTACELLRKRKRRERKPFAVMVRDLQTAQMIVHLTDADEELLQGPRSPIVLARLRRGHGLSSNVAPGILDLGIMLPTTPLHVELFRELNVDALVMTSGNASDEPICRGNRESIDHLSKLADVFLLHNRDVIRRIDDSIVRSTEEGPVMIRRSRGWVPEPLPMPVESPEPVLAMGGHLQVTTCLAVGHSAFLSQHIGDLDTAAARAFHLEAIDGLIDFLEVKPKSIVIDPHLDYPSRHLGEQLSRDFDARLIPVQHHVAHIAAAAGEHNRFPEHDEKIGGIALDGTGWGPDGTAWGGEFIELNGMLEWRRVGHLQPLILVGGEAAVREPWRIAVAALASEVELRGMEKLPLAYRLDPEKMEHIARLSKRGSWPLASGAGRLFEAAGALAGLRVRNTYEGEAALLLESLAFRARRATEPWCHPILEIGEQNKVLPSSALLAEMARRLRKGEKPENVAAGFHATFCKLTAQLAKNCFAPDIHTIAISGGCLVNRLIRSGLRGELQNLSYDVLMATNVPPGDGGLAYGQAIMGAVSLARSTAPAMMQAESCV